MTPGHDCRGLQSQPHCRPCVPTGQEQYLLEMAMNLSKLTCIALAASALSTAAWADSVAEQDQQRDVNQQERIEQGLKSGELSTKEAGRLERDEQHVDRMEAHDLKSGSMSPAEQARLNAAENKTSN